MEAKEQVLEAMKAAGKPVSAAQLAEKTGLDRADVNKAMTELKKTGEIVSPKACFWQPK